MVMRWPILIFLRGRFLRRRKCPRYAGAGVVAEAEMRLRQTFPGGNGWLNPCGRLNRSTRLPLSLAWK
jgi:hypothetical protein